MDKDFFSEKIKLLSQMDTITLSEMKEIRLMNRVDTKYMTNISNLPILLEKARQNYRVQVIDDLPIAKYQTVYHDTEDVHMYVVHHNRKLARQKVRTRTYINSDISFLEIKKKNNKGRTKKKRIAINPTEVLDFSENKEAINFLEKKSAYLYENLMPHVQNTFDRITLVNKEKTERLTIDFNLKFENYQTSLNQDVIGLMIIELKQDGLQHSYFKDYLFDLRIKPKSISKYCLGTMLTNKDVKTNRFKKKLMHINKIINH